MKIFSNKNFVAWYFVFPVAFIHLFVIGIPSLASLALCLTDWRGLGEINYIGFEKMFGDNFYEDGHYLGNRAIKTVSDYVDTSSYERLDTYYSQTKVSCYLIFFAIKLNT